MHSWVTAEAWLNLICANDPFNSQSFSSYIKLVSARQSSSFPATSCRWIIRSGTRSTSATATTPIDNLPAAAQTVAPAKATNQSLTHWMNSLRRSRENFGAFCAPIRVPPNLQSLPGPRRSSRAVQWVKQASACVAPWQTPSGPQDFEYEAFAKMWHMLAARRLRRRPFERSAKPWTARSLPAIRETLKWHGTASEAGKRRASLRETDTAASTEECDLAVFSHMKLAFNQTDAYAVHLVGLPSCTGQPHEWKEVWAEKQKFADLLHSSRRCWSWTNMFLGPQLQTYINI